LLYEVQKFHFYKIGKNYFFWKSFDLDVVLWIKSELQHSLWRICELLSVTYNHCTNYAEYHMFARTYCNTHVQQHAW